MLGNDSSQPQASTTNKKKNKKRKNENQQLEKTQEFLAQSNDLVDDLEERCDSVAQKGEDLAAKSKQFLRQAKKPSLLLNRYVNNINYPLMRWIIGFTGCGIASYVGIKGLINNGNNRKFALFATLIGLSGQLGMLYDLYC